MNSKECVICLHGLGRTRFSLRTLAHFLNQHHYQTLNIGYPSRKHTINYLAENVIGKAIEQALLLSPRKIHFVGHSLGGILVRVYLQQHTLPLPGRLVMLAPPNQGAELVDYLKHNKWLSPLFNYLEGLPGQALGTGPESIIYTLKPINIDVGVIAGNCSLEWWFKSLLKGPNDGKITVACTKLPEMKDFITLPYSHTFIMKNHWVHVQTEHFLRTGMFIKQN